MPLFRYAFVLQSNSTIFFSLKFIMPCGTSPREGLRTRPLDADASAFNNLYPRQYQVLYCETYKAS